jgi:hypothetical protein
MNNHWVLRTRMDNRKRRAPGRRLVRKGLDAHAVSADQKVRSMRAEVWVSLPRTRRRSVHDSRNLSRAPAASLVIGCAAP